LLDPILFGEAADRIEDLELELYDMNALYGQVKDGLEAKLAKALGVLRNIRELNITAEDENGHQWANSDLIEQEIVAVLAEIDKQ
jgi:hypothetical protein